MNAENKKDSAKSLYKRANALFEEYKFEESVPLYTKALKIKPNYANALFNRSLVKAIINDFHGAKEDLLKVVHFECKSPDTFYLLGVLAEYQQQSQLAEEFYRLALAVDSGFDKASRRLESLRSNHDSKYQSVTGHLPIHFDQWLSKNTKDRIAGEEVISAFISKPERGFESVVGMRREKDYLYDNVILAIKHPELFLKYGKSASAGIILYGPPGIGKTHLVRALSKESDSNLIVVRLHQLLDMYVGNTEKNIHSIFENARNNRPCIIYFDEIDGLGIDRSKSINSASGQHSLALAVNQLLSELDGFERNPESLFVIGATNRPQDIDPALKRSGRFTKLLYIRPPGVEERAQLFAYFTMNRPSEALDYSILAANTEYYTPAEILAVCDAAVSPLISMAHETGKIESLTTKHLLGVIAQDHSGTKAATRWYHDMQEFIDSGGVGLGDELTRDVKNAASASKKHYMLNPYNQ